MPGMVLLGLDRAATPKRGVEMDVFRVRDKLIEDYRDFTRSFVDIHGKAMRKHVDDRMVCGSRRTDLRLALNPISLPAGRLRTHAQISRPTTRRVRRLNRPEIGDHAALPRGGSSREHGMPASDGAIIQRPSNRDLDISFVLVSDQCVVEMAQAVVSFIRKQTELSTTQVRQVKATIFDALRYNVALDSSDFAGRPRQLPGDDRGRAK
jgi:hypothetical protein